VPTHAETTQCRNLVIMVIFFLPIILKIKLIWLACTETTFLLCFPKFVLTYRFESHHQYAHFIRSEHVDEYCGPDLVLF